MEPADPPAKPSAFSRALKRVVDEQLFTLKELADVADVSRRHLNDVKNQEAYLNHEAADRIRRYCCDNGEKLLSETGCSTGYEVCAQIEGEANNSVDDDYIEICDALTRIKEAEADRDQRRGRAQLQVIKKELRDLELEINEWEP